MRMFLVGMCDIFLLLYLTALAQIEEKPVSDLTVKDYLALSASKASLEAQASETDRKLAAAESALREREVKTKQQERDRAALMAAVEESQRRQAQIQRSAENAKLAEQQIKEDAARVRKVAQEARAAEEAARAELKMERENARQALEKARVLTQEVISKQADLDKARQIEMENRRLFEEEQKKLAEARQRADEALAEAARNRAAAEQADARAANAQTERTEALRTAQLAHQAQLEALKYADLAVANGEVAADRAERAMRSASAASAEGQSAQQKIRELSQPAQSAYVLNVERRLTTVDIQTATKSLFGNQKNSIRLAVVPLRFGDTVVAIVPKDHFGLTGFSDAADLTHFEATAGGHGVDALYTNPDFANLVGILLPSSTSAASSAPVSKISSLMPTLIAVRNGSELELSDILRGVNSSYFFFPRDRLTFQERPRRLVFAAEGFRGTGDYAEQIITGDQVVDLEGRLVGIAESKNTIAPISDLSSWRRFELNGVSPEMIAREVGGFR